MNYKGIVSRARVFSPELKKNFCPPLFSRVSSCKVNLPLFSNGTMAVLTHALLRECKQKVEGDITLPSLDAEHPTTPSGLLTYPLPRRGLGIRVCRGILTFGTKRSRLPCIPEGSANPSAVYPYPEGVDQQALYPEGASEAGVTTNASAYPNPEGVGQQGMQAKEFHQKTTDSLWDQKRPTYPFTAIVGQEEMKLALLLNVIDPKIGGVMIMGDRGTGKSTTVRALIDLLPTIEVVENDPFNSHPSDAELMSQNVREQVLQGKSLKVIKKKTQMIDLPLGATEDRVCGTIDIERALSEGIKAFEPGLLAKANRGILYVDEVNLLDDHLVDILLDSAASGWNTVEREGISISHPARFILVGSGNPEEGELRPQLLDRFGMHAQIGTVREAELRVKIVEERANFDRSPLDFLALHIEKQKELADKIVAARHILGAIKIDYDLRVKISQVCGQLNVDGLRGDIVTNRASQALAAFEARTSVTPQDIFRVIPLCLRHRLRKDPLESIDSGDRVREVFKQVFGFMS